MTKNRAILGKKFVQNFSELLLDKIPKLWYNGSSGLRLRLRPGQITALYRKTKL